MIPMGYMAKRVIPPPEFLSEAKGITDVYSVSNCVNDDFADFVDLWKHNGFWFFDNPELILEVAQQESADLSDTKLFYYEAHEFEYAGESWRSFGPWQGWPKVDVAAPRQAMLEGFDVVTFWPENSSQPLHSPLSCNNLAEEIPTNPHCLLNSFEATKSALEGGNFAGCEPGPYRIFAVYSVDTPWPPHALAP